LLVAGSVIVSGLFWASGTGVGIVVALTGGLSSGKRCLRGMSSK
jgi:hypothetical protein